MGRRTIQKFWQQKYSSSERLTPNHNGQDNGEDMSESGLAINKESGAHPERKAIVQEDDAEERSNHTSQSSFAADTPFSRFLQVDVVFLSKFVLSRKGYGHQ